jgi:anti-sigma-K factor RskA
MTEPHANPEDFDLYALSALDGEEKQRFEAHVRACSACRQQLAETERRVSLLGLSADPATPRPQVKSALMEQVKSERKATGSAQDDAQKPKRIRWGLRFSLGFGLATAVLAFATFELARQDVERGKQLKQLQAQVSQQSAAMQAMGQVAGAPDTTLITLLEQNGEPPGQAHVMYNARMGMAVYSGQIAPAPPDKSYQLWLVPASGAPVSAGLVEPNQETGIVVVHLTPGMAAKAFAVTMEPLGGMPQPTGPKVLVGVVNS